MKPSSGSTPVRGSSGSPGIATAPAAPTPALPPLSPLSPVPPVDEHCRRTPAAPLRPYVAWYAGYRQRGIAPARHRGLPSPFLTLIFTLDEPIVHQGAQSGVQLALRPLGVRLLLGLPAGELADIDVPAEAVLGGVGAELHTRVAAGGLKEDWTQ